jgi:eukaryotic-like serine/threonine-protein kinase
VTNPYLKIAEERVGASARKWTLDRLLDVGGMAAVYAATHKNGNRVAIKVLHPQFSKMPEAKERFLREGYVANKVGHEHAVTVLDDDVLEDGTPFIVMELLEGQSLEDRVRAQGVLSPAETLFVSDQVLDVLGAAHERGIIHRDIKPPNVFLTVAGTVKVLDFGLARVLDGAVNMTLTRTGTVVGTASYMSPEQARGKRELIDHRTDIFAVGAVMFRCLAGRTIHMNDNPMERLMSAMSERAPSLGSLVPDLPGDVVALVDRALAFQKGERWPDARSMQKELRAIYHRHSRTPIPTGGRPPQSVAGWTRPLAAAAVGHSPDDIHVSVVFEEAPSGESILVEMSDIDTGREGKFELRRKGKPPPSATDEEPLSELSVQTLPDPPTKKS